MNIYILKMDRSFFELDMGGAVSATMRKTAFGWIVEVTAPNGWENDTIYWWPAATAKEAYKDIHHILRKQQRCH